MGYRALILWVSSTHTKSYETDSHYKIEEFQHNPGIYYEKIGRLHYARGTWKLVIRLDIAALNERHGQIVQYLQQTEKICDTMRLQSHYHKEACINLDIIAKKEAKYLRRIMTQIQTIYKPNTNRRRGLIDGIGSIAKSLFGTMDANDEKHINEQINLLENNQQTLQHAARNQIKILNATVAHIDELDSIIERNAKLLQKRMTEYTERVEINEHFTTIIAIITDLIRDAENAIEYLTYIRKGAMHPKLMPIDSIITNLKEATQQLPQGLYFPFKVHAEDWLTIEEYATISAYYNKTHIYTILRFPSISQPSYEVINVIAFPVPDYNNIFTVTDTKYNMIAVDKEKLTHLRLTKNELKNCINVNQQYTCKDMIPIYRVNSNSPCEIQMYTQQQHNNCKIKHIISKDAIWIALQQPHIWLYSIATDQQIVIQCDGRREHRQIIRNTGKIILRGKCKLTIADMTLQSTETNYETDIETYLPEVNVTLLRDHDTLTQDNDTLKDVIKHRAELTKLKDRIEKVDSDLQVNEQKFFVKKQFIYPMASSGIITLILILLIIWMVIKNRKNKKYKRPSVRIYEDNEPFKSYGFPRPILKRSLSTRF